MTALTNKGSKERSGRLADLRKRGSFLHNIETIRSGHGTFIVQRRSSTKSCTPLDYRCCPSCLGYYTKQSMSHHSKSCCRKEGTIKSVKAFNFALTAEHDSDMHPVTSIMIDDDITRIVIADRLIMKFGKKLYARLLCTGTVSKQETYVSTKMRELARLIRQIRSATDETASLEELIVPSMFNKLVEATLSISHFRDKDLSNSLPSLALKIGYSLKRSSNDALIEAIENRDEKREVEIEKFLKLMSLEWGERVSAGALIKLKQKKATKANPMPLAEDLKVCMKVITCFIYNYDR